MHVTGSSTIPATGEGIGLLRRQVVVHADPLTAWRDWASAEAIEQWWQPPSTNIDLRVGGPFEILFDMNAPEGLRGSEGCIYLSYVPGEMISFTWNAPPHLPLREAHTWVVITFTPQDTRSTAVELVHTGFLDGPDWRDYMSYFESAWAHVLGLQQRHHDNRHQMQG